MSKILILFAGFVLMLCWAETSLSLKAQSEDEIPLLVLGVAFSFSADEVVASFSFFC